MNRRMSSFLGFLMAFALVVAGCGATEEPAPAPGEQPTEAAPGLDTPVPQEPVTIVIWHGYTETEERLFSETVQEFRDANPNITVDTLAVPFAELQNKFQTEVSAGEGPTLTTGPQDRMAAYASAGLLAPVPQDAPFLANLVEGSTEGGMVDGDLLGVPINNKVLALFYNTSVIEAPPADWDELLALSEEHGMALTQDWFHNYMWLPAFGAQLFDEDFRCVLHETGAAEALAYYDRVCESPGVVCDPNDGNMDTLFRSGEVAFRIQGPWMSADAIADLGAENIAVTRIPPIPGQGDPRPWNQVEVASVSVNATPAEQDAALRFIDYLTSTEVQSRFLEEANWIPVNADVDTSANPVVAGFLEQVPVSDPFPVAPELAATWDPMQNAVNQIIEGVSTPEDAMTQACELINTTNNK